MSSEGLVERGDPVDPVERWGRLTPWLLLLVGTGLALATNASFGDGGTRTVAAVALVLAAAGWMVAWQPALRTAPPGSAPATTAYAGRTLLAGALTVVNPFYGFFAFVGYLDAYRCLGRRWGWTGLLATAVLLAGSQSGGLPPDDAVGWLVFGVLCLLNGGLGVAFGAMGERDAALSRRRAEEATELAAANARLRAALEENAGLQAQLVEQAREAGVLDERARLAREIHDTLAQDLAGVLAQLQAADVARDAGAAGDHRRRAMELARRGLVEARRSVDALRPAALDERSLPTALEELVRSWAERGAPVRLVRTGQPVALHPELEATLLRVAQEALGNAARHAAATRIVVTLSYGAADVVLDVRDDGRGFDPARRRGGFGLVGMAQRVRSVGGTVEVETAPGQGTAVSAVVPAVPAADTVAWSER